MNPMQEDLARATIQARLAWAEDRRQGRRIEQEKRQERRRRRRLAITRWWQSRPWCTPAVRGATWAAAVTRIRSPSAELARVLEEAAHHVADCGTSSEALLLQAMAEVAAPSAPGAAAALVDRDGSEVSRLRAFGFLHTHLVEALGPREHALVLELRTGGALGQPGRVA